MEANAKAHQLNSQGLQLASEKKYGEALTCFREAARLAPQEAEYQENLGLTLRRTGEDAEAARALRQAISLRARSPKATAALGELMLEHGNITGAVECFRRAFDMEPGTAWGHVQMARAFLEAGNTESAAQCAEVSTKLDPSCAQAYTVIGTAMQELGRFSEAQKALLRSVELLKDQAEAYHKLVFGKKLKEEDRWLVESMQKVLEDGPRTQQERRLLNYALGKAYEDLGAYEKAMGCYDEANDAAFKLQLGGRPFDTAAYKADVDKTIRKFTKDFFERNAHLGSPSDTPIFVIGLMRSGTTLLEQILGRHSKIGIGGETSFWMSKGAPAVRQIIDSPVPNSPKQICGEYLHMLTGLAPGKSYVTDKDPLNFKYIGEIRFAFPKARFIHCRRDPVDNCLSIYTTPYRIPADFCCNRNNIVFGYREYLRLMDHWRSVLPENALIEIDYETLVTEQEKTTREILRFLGLDWEEACLNTESSKGRIGTPSFWQARQPVYKSSVNRASRFEGLLGVFEQLRAGK